MMKFSVAGALAGLAIVTSIALAGLAAAQQAPLSVGGTQQPNPAAPGTTGVTSTTTGQTQYPAAPTTATPVPSPSNPIEQNNAVGFIRPGEVPAPLDTVNTQRLAVPMEYLRNDGVRDTLGGITAYEMPDGLYFKVVVTRFTPGFKGFNLLSHGNCDPFARNGRLELGGAAGELYNPTGAKKHAGPFVPESYLGALPKTEANSQGWIFMTLVAPRLKLADLRGRALVLREYDDNYKASPPLGGAGGIAACGLVR